MSVRDRVGEFLAERTPRRFVALACFIGALVLFRKLLLLLAFFVAFERLIGWTSERLAERTGMRRKPALALVTVLTFLVSGGGLALGIGWLVRVAKAARQTLPERIAAVRQLPAFKALEEHLQEGAQRLVEGAQHYAASALKVLSTVGHVGLYALIGFILAVVFLLERDELSAFARARDPRSLAGTLLRWFGHVADAMVVTVQFQLVVAACNAVLTLPVLFVVGIPHAAPLALMIFVSGMVPVVGNVVSGAILSLLAYQAKGWLGVGLFVGLTFVLHKLESYYLNPRLAARHVKLPGFVLIVSLIAWEHVLGFVGLFVSFPFLFVAGRIRDELRAETAERAPAEPVRLEASEVAAGK